MRLDKTLIVLVLIPVFIAVGICYLEAQEEKQTSVDVGLMRRMLNGAEIYVNVTNETPWGALPMFIREKIAQRHAATLLSKEDLIEIRDYYQQKIDAYDDGLAGVSTKRDFQRDGRLK